MPMKKIHSLLYAMERVPDIGKTRLMKFVFFVDLISLNQRGMAVFDSTYIRMPKGPVDQFSFSFTGETNSFFDVVAPEVSPMVDTRIPQSGAGRAPYRQGHQRIKFTPKVPADISLFSPYETVLFDSVLHALRPRSATSVSEITHQLRLWQQYNDGDIIPPEALYLEQYEKKLLRDQGFFFDGFSNLFCSEVLRDAHRLEDLAFPLKSELKHSITSSLDGLVRAYPVDTYESFYDAYLAWDDAYRLALEHAPTHLGELASKGSEALCTYAIGMETRCMEPPRLHEFAAAFTHYVEQIRSSLLTRSDEHTARKEGIDDYVDRLMCISCDLALQR